MILIISILFLAYNFIGLSILRLLMLSNDVHKWLSVHTTIGVIVFWGLCPLFCIVTEAANILKVIKNKL